MRPPRPLAVALVTLALFTGCARSGTKAASSPERFVGADASAVIVIPTLQHSYYREASVGLGKIPVQSKGLLESGFRCCNILVDQLQPGEHMPGADVFRQVACCQLDISFRGRQLHFREIDQCQAEPA